MLFILSLIGTVSFVLLFRKAMKKYAVPFYLVATAITVFFLVYRPSGNIQIPDVINKYVMKPLSQGTISTALFSIVMWIGALNRKNPVVKKLFSIRGEMSIIACILTLSHNIYFGIIFFPMLFTSPGSMSTTHFIAICITLVLIALMIPLMVTSFITIRKKMKFASWKKLQRLAYVFYMLIYVHVMLMFVPKISMDSSYILNIAVYSVVFLGYAICRVIKAVSVKNGDLVKAV